ncbi:helix-turn-helix transcriptional regulator [Haladaptatus sp. CMAA 1911]|uniref:helix-turn-helix transcriptional regulator n=1 Tax=unclassified Haladaptatus TaxID=2622732 RepID=UPI003754CFE4
MEFALNDENETEAFERLGTDFERGGNDDLGFSAETFRQIARIEQAETGREMKIRNVDRESVVANETGLLTLSFVWTNFTRVNDDKIYLGDAFLFDGGESTWLRSLSANQNLFIHTPDGYQIQNSNFGHTNGTIPLYGPMTIRSSTGGRDFVRVTYNEVNPGPVEESTSWTMYIAGLLVLVGIIGAGIYAFLQRDGDEPDLDSDPSDSRSVPSPDPDSDSEPAEDEPDLELLSDEERVEHLLQQSGGRMKQATIVKETNWSNAKVSQLLSAMNDSDRIDKLRIGRENLITLPGEDVTDFDDE